MLNEFIAYLEEQVKNRSIYIWGGQGQGWPTVNEEWITKKESGSNRQKALDLYRQAAEAGFKEKLKAFDCSGLGMYWLFNIKGVYPSDMTANGMMGKCMPLTKDELSRGDWVFRTYKSGEKKGRAYHVGFIVDDELNVIEAKGRAYGVVKRPFDENYWNTYARPVCFADEILGIDFTNTNLNVSRNLKYGCIGRDVMHLQKCVGADSDGDFGSKTRAAVKAFQKASGLTLDGIAGINTITALKGRWKRNDTLKIGTFNVKRGKSSKSVCKKIANATAECDIIGLQEVTSKYLPYMSFDQDCYLCKTVGDYGHAVLTKLKPETIDVFELPEGGEKRKLCRMEFTKNGRKIGYYNTHIQFTSANLSDINLKQINKVLDIIEDDPCDVIILTGDFNCTGGELKSIFEPAGYTVLNSGEPLQAIHIKEGSAYPMDNIIIKGAVLTDRWVYPAIKRKISDHDAFFAEVVL